MSQDPDPILARSRASALMDLGRYEDAIGPLRVALAADPDDLEARRLLAFCLLLTDQPTAARDQAGYAIGVDPEAGWPHLIHSMVLQRQGRHEPAVAAAREATRLAPHASQHHAQLAFALAGKAYTRALTIDERREIKEAASEARRLAPFDTEAIRAQVAVAQALHDPVRAEKLRLEILALDPHHAEARTEQAMANVEWSRGISARQSGAALRDVTRVLVHHPHDEGALAAFRFLTMGLLVRAASVFCVVALCVGWLLVLLRPSGVVAAVVTALLAIGLAAGGGYAAWQYARLPQPARRDLLRLLRQPKAAGGLALAAVAAVLMVLACGLGRVEMGLAVGLQVAASTAMVGGFALMPQPEVVAQARAAAQAEAEARAEARRWQMAPFAVVLVGVTILRLIVSVGMDSGSGHTDRPAVLPGLSASEPAWLGSTYAQNYFDRYETYPRICQDIAEREANGRADKERAEAIDWSRVTGVWLCAWRAESTQATLAAKSTVSGSMTIPTAGPTAAPSAAPTSAGEPSASASPEPSGSERPWGWTVWNSDGDIGPLLDELRQRPMTSPAPATPTPCRTGLFTPVLYVLVYDDGETQVPDLRQPGSCHERFIPSDAALEAAAFRLY